jgi:hypothetical protein
MCMSDVIDHSRSRLRSVIWLLGVTSCGARTALPGGDAGGAPPSCLPDRSRCTVGVTAAPSNALLVHAPTRRVTQESLRRCS